MPSITLFHKRAPKLPRKVILTVHNLSLRTSYSFMCPEEQAYRLVTSVSAAIEQDPHVQNLCMSIEDVKH